MTAKSHEVYNHNSSCVHSYKSCLCIQKGLANQMAFEGCLNDLNGLILLTLSHLSLPFSFGCLWSLSCTHFTTIALFC